MNNLNRSSAWIFSPQLMNALHKSYSLRIGEAVIMSGFFLIGCFFAVPEILHVPLDIIPIFSGILFYILAVYGLNSYTDYRYDRLNPRLHHVSRVHRRQYALLTVFYFTVCLLIFYFIKPVLSVYALCGFGLWCAYYIPPLKLKARFLGGTSVHLIAGVIHFHLGYAALSELNFQSVAIASYFSIILAAGHLHHELIDYHSDRTSNIKTTTVRIGYFPGIKIMEILFLFSLAYWTLLFFASIINEASYFPFSAASVFIVLLYFKYNPKKMEPLAFRLYYRIIFGLAGIVFIVLKTAGAG